MKKYLIAIMTILLVAVFGACNNKENGETDNKENPYFNATVLTVSEEEILVSPFDDEAVLKSADQIAVPISAVPADKLPDIQAGCLIRIEYDGKILETYPAQLANVYGISFVNKDGEIVDEPVIDDEPETAKTAERDLDEIKDYLAAFPDELEELKKLECYIVLHGEEAGGSAYLADFCEAVLEKKPAHLLLVQFTTEGDAILDYIDYNGTDFYLVDDSSRDAFAGTGEKITATVYPYGSYLEGTLAEGTAYKCLFLMEKEELTEQELKAYVESDFLTEGIDEYPLFYSVCGNTGN